MFILYVVSNFSFIFTKWFVKLVQAIDRVHAFLIFTFKNTCTPINLTLPKLKTSKPKHVTEWKLDLFFRQRHEQAIFVGILHFLPYLSWHQIVNLRIISTVQQLSQPKCYS